MEVDSINVVVGSGQGGEADLRGKSAQNSGLISGQFRGAWNGGVGSAKGVSSNQSVSTKRLAWKRPMASGSRIDPVMAGAGSPQPEVRTEILTTTGQKEPEVDWALGVTWTMIAEELPALPTFETCPDTEGKPREIDLNVTRAAEKLGRHWARNRPTRKPPDRAHEVVDENVEGAVNGEPGLEAGEMRLNSERRSVSAADGFEQVKSRSGGRRRMNEPETSSGVSRSNKFGTLMTTEAEKDGEDDTGIPTMGVVEENLSVGKAVVSDSALVDIVHTEGGKENERMRNPIFQGIEEWRTIVDSTTENKSTEEVAITEKDENEEMTKAKTDAERLEGSSNQETKGETEVKNPYGVWLSVLDERSGVSKLGRAVSFSSLEGSAPKKKSCKLSRNTGSSGQAPKIAPVKRRTLGALDPNGCRKAEGSYSPITEKGDRDRKTQRTGYLGPALSQVACHN
ncbi:hypothetical protein R1sor_016613 [Riccia sorocarpa]|uniref:Uncharacterized protein n=1 Tax=Riccia sorocarpa TaxID=122646 RepID=A0ABD3HLR8_9MARC